MSAVACEPNKERIWKCKDNVLSYQARMLVMGILNVTPDSFSDGGLFYSPEEALRCAQMLEADGADVLDIGAESTRPGSEPISPDQELSRLIPALKLISDKVNIPISVDTYHSKTAREALRFGASIINDIWGLQKDPQMAQVVAENKAGVVIMANYTDPMLLKRSGNILEDCLNYFEESRKIAESAGIEPSQILYDPGIGFGTNTEESKILIRSIPTFQAQGYPILIGHSRKRFIGEILGGMPVESRDAATTAVSLYCARQHAACVRVHNVKDSVTACIMQRALEED